MVSNLVVLVVAVVTLAFVLGIFKCPFSNKSFSLLCVLPDSGFESPLELSLLMLPSSPMFL